jgi:GTP-binding protein HflX
MSETVHGNTLGLKPNQIRRLEKLYDRRVPPHRIVSQEFARHLTELSHEIRRQVGVLVDRGGYVEAVAVGDAASIEIPDISRARAGGSRLRGLRLLHTHLRGERLTQDDLTDLALLRLDVVAAVTVDAEGLPGVVHAAHLAPGTAADPWTLLDPRVPSQFDDDFLDLVEELEAEFARTREVRSASDRRDRAILVSVTTGGATGAEESLDELAELARSSGVVVLDQLVQRRSQLDPRTLVGSGKLKELLVHAMQLGVDMIIFDRDLTPAQVRSINAATDLKVVDRTQLILDIFAQRAQSREGKIQVELAQLKYVLPRLTGSGAEMSRLAGGIGGRGPGETKLEVDRRRARDRIHHLERQIEEMRKHRRTRRQNRDRRALPVVSIVGYTNAGKSTLLNALTGSGVLAENRMFATLDPTSRRLRLPRDREIIINDTVGFIRDLPQDLIVAFRATLEEMEGSDLLLHLVDASSPQMEAHIASVERILGELELTNIPRILVLNKTDLLDAERLENLTRAHEAIAISAVEPKSLVPLVERMGDFVGHDLSTANAHEDGEPAETDAETADEIDAHPDTEPAEAGR